MSYTEAQLKSIVVTPMILSGLASFLGFFTLIIMILRSELKLTVPARRYAFITASNLLHMPSLHSLSPRDKVYGVRSATLAVVMLKGKCWDALITN